MLTRKRERDTYGWKLLVLVLVIGLLAGVLGGVLAGYAFIKPGPQGEEGPAGETGPQGPQGIPGVDGTDAILQIIQNRNDAQVDTGNYTAMQWHNMSDFDSSMEITIDVQQNSRVFAQFSCTHELEPPASIWVRIVVDSSYNSTTCVCAIGPPAAGTYRMTGHIEFLTNSLNAGSHTINVQFLRESGSPEILDRTLTVTEIASQ